MNTADLRALQAEIHASAACTPFIHTNDMPAISGADAVANDQAIADILNDGRTALISYKISERGVREALDIVAGATFLKALRELSEASDTPAWMSAALTQAGIPVDDHWAYFDTMHCAWKWLQDDGLDIGASKPRQLLDLMAMGIPALASAITSIKATAMVPCTITASTISRAVRGPWGDE